MIGNPRKYTSGWTKGSDLKFEETLLHFPIDQAAFMKEIYVLKGGNEVSDLKKANFSVNRFLSPVFREIKESRLRIYEKIRILYCKSDL